MTYYYCFSLRPIMHVNLLLTCHHHARPPFRQSLHQQHHYRVRILVSCPPLPQTPHTIFPLQQLVRIFQAKTILFVNKYNS